MHGCHCRNHTRRNNEDNNIHHYRVHALVAWSLCIVGASADEQLEVIYAKDLERKEQREKLSRVIQCDRCGKTYEKNERYQTRGSVEGSVLSGITTITGMGLRDESYDLCDECIGELLDWLRNEQNDEGAEK